MGNKCACCSCCQTRPRYKQHVRAAVFNNQIESLGKFALRTPTQLNDIGRYIKKQIVNNLQNDLRVRYAMQSYSEIIKFCMDDNKNKVLSNMDDYVVECCQLLLLEGFKHNNVDYIMYAMQTLKSLLQSVQDRFFAFQRLSDIFDLLIKIGRSEHMESDSYYSFNTNSHHHHNQNKTHSHKEPQLSYKSDSFIKSTSNINGFTEKTIIYHALDTLKLAVEYSYKNQMVDTKFTELMSLFIYNLRPMDIAKSMLNTTTINAQKTIENNNKTSVDIEQIAMKGFELLCSHIAGFNNDKLHFTLEQIEQDIRRYDIQYVLTLLKTISKKSGVNAIDIAKTIADTVKYKGISTSAELYKIRPATKMIEILIKYSSYCEKSNRYQLISSLCDCIKWLDDIPVSHQPTVAIYHCQQEREKLYVGANASIDTHNFARIQTLRRAEVEEKENKKNKNNTNNNNKNKEGYNNLNKHNNKQLQLPIPSSIFTQKDTHSDVSSVGNIKEDNDKLSALFVFANKCLECISVYVSYHDIQSTLSRAILPRLSKARSFWHKKYLIHAAMETALQKQSSSSSVSNKRSCLTPNILRYILQCPFLNNDSINELHKNELIDLTQLLIHNLSLIPQSASKSLFDKHKMNDIFMIHVLEFEHMISTKNVLKAKEKPDLSSLDRQSKKWIYAVIYEEIINSNGTQLPLYILQSFCTTINIIFQSAINEDILADDLKYILILLQALQKYAVSFDELDVDNTQPEYGIVIHTWILSLLFCLSRCFNQSSPRTQELISRLKNIKNQRINAHQMWSNFVLDEFGLIETVNSMNMKLKCMRKESSLKDESIRVPFEQIFGAITMNTQRTDETDLIEEELKLQDDDSDIDSPNYNRQKSHSAPSNEINIKLESVTHLIPFEKLLPLMCKCLNIEDGQEQKQWMADILVSNKKYSVIFDADYSDLFASPNVFSRPGYINEASSVHNSESGGDYASSERKHAWDQSSIPSELYFGVDVFKLHGLQGNKHSLKNLFDQDMDSNLKLKLRKNILTKKHIEKMNDFYDVIDVYNAQTDHGDYANDTFFNNLQEKINAQSECKQLTNTFGFEDGSNDAIIGFDEEQDDDQKKRDDPYLSFKTQTQTPSLFKISYKSNSDILSSNYSHKKYDKYENEANMYLLIDMDMDINEYIKANEQQIHNETYKGTTILNKDFEYRLGLKQFDFEQGYNSVEYELEGLNFHYVDPNDVMDTAFNYAHHHQDGYNFNYNQQYHGHGYDYYESEMSEDSDEDQYIRKRGISRSSQKKKKKFKRKKFNKQLERKFKAFGKGFRDKIEDIKQRGKHAQNDSNENINIELSNLEIKRQASSPATPTDDNIEIKKSIYLRKQLTQIQAGSLTEGDEPLYDIKINDINKKNLKIMHKKPMYQNKIPSASTTPERPRSALHQNPENNNINHHHHRGHSGHSLSSSTHSVFDIAARGMQHTNINNNNNIIEEEDPECDQSDIESH